MNLLRHGRGACRYFRSDNSGPPDTLLEIKLALDTARRVFPGAEIIPSSLGAFATEALTDAAVDALPEFEFEWGDVWITGMSTDPRRLAVYREIVRARADCLDQGECVRDSVERDWVGKNRTSKNNQTVFFSNVVC